MNKVEDYNDLNIQSKQTDCTQPVFRNVPSNELSDFCEVVMSQLTVSALSHTPNITWVTKTPVELILKQQLMPVRSWPIRADGAFWRWALMRQRVNRGAAAILKLSISQNQFTSNRNCVVTTEM